MPLSKSFGPTGTHRPLRKLHPGAWSQFKDLVANENMSPQMILDAAQHWRDWAKSKESNPAFAGIAESAKWEAALMEQRVRDKKKKKKVTLMPATMVFKVLSAGSPADMENKLNEAAAEGWQLHTIMANQFGSTTVAHALMHRHLTAKEMK